MRARGPLAALHGLRKTSFFYSLDHQWRNWPAHREACTRIRLARDAAALAPYAGVDEVEGAVRAWFAARRAESDTEAAAEAAADRARIAGLDERTLRRELSRRAIELPADAPREALLARSCSKFSFARMASMR